MLQPMTPLEYFTMLVAEVPGQSTFPLTEAAIAVAQDMYPRLDLVEVQSRIDRMGVTLRKRLPADATPLTRLRALNRYFFRDLGFAGNRNDYYDPDNSHLNCVIDRRLGIPITLAVLYMEIGQQIGLALRGVSFPGHFLVKLSVRSGDIFIDPYNGQSLSRTDLEQRLAQFFDESSLSAPGELDLMAALQEAPPRDILLRLLRNLKGAYHDLRDYPRVLAVQQRLVALRPHIAEERRDRGLIYAQLDCPRAALADLTYYLEQQGDAPEAEEIRRTIAVLRSAVGRN